MGLLSKLFAKNVFSFQPDFSKSEYDNWLDYMGMSGTDEQWQSLKIKNGWIFPKSSTEIFMEYQKALEPISSKYYDLLEKIEKDWSALYNLREYEGTLAHKVEKECIDAINYFEKMHDIDIKYGEVSPQNIPAFKRLAMLYERQGKYESSVNICKQAIHSGMDERARMLRMVKKAGRTPTDEEMKLINNK